MDRKILIQALTDPENQPHQWVGDAEGLRAALQSGDKGQEAVNHKWIKEQIEISDKNLACVPKAQREAMAEFVERPSRADEPQKVGGWMPIESAPRDAGYIMGINMRGKVAGEPFIMRNTFIADEKFISANPEACWAEKGHDWPCYPTHWQPLPAPPTSEGV